MNAIFDTGRKFRLLKLAVYFRDAATKTILQKVSKESLFGVWPI